MATIKEVAKRAGVSIGTASNVINGKTQNEELIQRVEKAIEELGYRPDANARSLKNTQSGLIGVVLPDVLEKGLADFLHDLERILRGKGYSVLVKFSRNNKLIEKKCLESCVEQGVDGIILYSMTREKPSSLLKNENIPSVMVGRRNNPDFSGDQIVIDYGMAFAKTFDFFRNRGISKVGLIIEKDLMDSDILEYHKSCCPEEGFQKIVGGSQEQGFQGFFELYTTHPDIQAVTAGSSMLARGVKKAADILGLEKLEITTVKESSWIEDAGLYSAQLSVSSKALAEMAAAQLLDAIEKPNTHECITTVIKAQYDKFPASAGGVVPAAGDLRFAMYDCSSSRSLKMLSRIYEKESGRKVHFDLMPYDRLEDVLYQKAREKNGDYDGFMMDITWLEGLVESGVVQNLDSLKEENRNYFEGFIDGVLKDCCMYVESLYAVPFMSGAQILFYQKDLFEDRALQIRYKRQYKEELLPPETWAQFNLTAEFFTKEFNPKSPVKYGVSIPKGVNVYTTVGFLSRLWSYGSRVFDERGRLVINNANSIAALRNLIQAYRYTSGRNLNSWNDIADEFGTGESAMVILYDSDAGDINNYTKSKVAGNLGYALLPGRTPVLGGWSLGLNQYGKNMKDAQQFLQWACGEQNGIPLPLLGGSTLRKDFYSRSDLEDMEPWKPLILKSYQQSRKRTMPEILDDSRLKNNIYTELIPKEIMRVLSGEITERDAVVNMEEKISRLIDG